MTGRAAPRHLAGALLPLLLAFAGCSASGSTHLPLPQVENNGGGTLSAPEIVTVTFDPNLYMNPAEGVDLTSSQAADMVSDLQNFDDGIASTAWWSTVTADYCDPSCVGQPGAHVTIAAEPPGDGTSTCDVGPDGQPVQPCYTDTAVGGSASLKAYLTGLFDDGTLPPPTPQTLYVFYLPSSVVINVDGSVTCVAIGGYHDSIDVGALNVPYAIVPICPPESTSGATPELTVEQTATLAASHEIVEATTDPHAGETPAGDNPYSNLGWYLTDSANVAWTIFAGGEVADLCVDILELGQDRWTEGDYIYQRVWSNSQAAAGSDPCVPTPAGEVYFNAGPTAIEDEQLQMPLGATRSYDVVAFADGAMPSWSVGAMDPTIGTVGNPVPILGFTPSFVQPAAVRDGSSVPLSIMLDGEPQAQPGEPPGTPPFEGYLIVSFAVTGGVVTAAHYWPGLVEAP